MKNKGNKELNWRVNIWKTEQKRRGSETRTGKHRRKCNIYIFQSSKIEPENGLIIYGCDKSLINEQIF